MGLSRSQRIARLERELSRLEVERIDLMRVVAAALAYERALAGDQFDMVIQTTQDLLIREVKKYRAKCA